jgi:hypothetical protein
MAALMGAAVGAPVREVQVGAARFQLTDLSRSDGPALIALHTRVFGPGASEEWYQWKYVLGQGLGTGLWHEGELIAHCGGVPRTLCREGRQDTGLQIGDVMVAPEWRGILTRRGPFFQVSHAFYSAHVGARCGHAVAFGFPSERHLRLAVTLKLLWNAGPVHVLSWNVEATTGIRPVWPWRWDPLDPSDSRFDASVNAAWQRMRAAGAALTLGQRDAAYVRWRYCERPGQRCRFILLRKPWSRTPVGIAVLDIGATQVQWLDWIGDPAAIVAASRACIAEAARAGVASLSAWASPAVTQSLQNSGVAHKDVTAWLGIPRASSVAEEDLASMRWWLMGGDTDFL